uniref:ATP synthase F0 subunit 8 n=1 Tax=Glyphohesione klatti TaxID=3053539 RepID=UPI0030E15F57
MPQLAPLPWSLMILFPLLFFYLSGVFLWWQQVPIFPPLSTSQSLTWNTWKW